MYKYTVFISYKWNGEYEEWVNKIFYPIVKNYFIDTVGNNDVFKDEERVKYGEDLFSFLEGGLVHSKCMIAVLNGPYFCKSVWCPKEFSVMLHRHKIHKTGNGKSLLFPLIFTKRDRINDRNINSLKNICPNLSQWIEDNFTPLLLEEDKYLRTTNAFRESADYDDLKIRIKNWLNDSIIPSLQTAPTWQEAWDSKLWLEAPYEDFKSSIDCTDFYKQPLL